MTIVRDGYYLLDNEPRRSQGRPDRRAPLKPVVVWHTPEAGTDTLGEDLTAENVARFIATRTDPGSYATVGDRDSIIPLLPVTWETWSDGTGSNRWAVHLSIGLNAADWPKLTTADRDAYVETMAHMAAKAAFEIEAVAWAMPAPELLTKAESEAPDASGFTTHARRDPERRSDPGKDSEVPWDEFFARYAELTNQTIETKEPTVATKPNEYVRQIQDLVGATVDGIAGPQTLAKVETALRVNADRASAFEQQRDSALSALANLEANEVDGQKWRDFMTLISTTKGGNQ